MSQENINIPNNGNNLLPVSDLLKSILKQNTIPNTYSKEDIIKNESFFNRDQIQIPLSNPATKEELKKIFSNMDRTTHLNNNFIKKQKN